MQQIRSIHYLRGVAALLVVGFHLRSNLNDIYPIKSLGDYMFMGGASGVDLFFIISGFIMMYSTTREISASNFLIRRLFRIFPVFLFLLMLFYIIFPGFKTDHLLRSILLIHSDYSETPPFYGYNTLVPAWTLTYEMYFYMIFVISMSISQKYRGLISSVLLVMPVFLFQLVYNKNIDLYGTTSANISDENLFFGFIRFASSPMMIEFCYGIAFFYISKSLKNIKHYEVIAFSCFVFFVCSYLSWFRFFHGPINFGLWAITLIFGALVYESNKEIKEIRLFNFLGNISYSLYLTQGVILTTLNYYEANIPIYNSGAGIVRFTLSMSLCIVVAYFVYHYIETPFINYGKRLCSAIKQRNIATA